MSSHAAETVLLVCHDEDRAREILAQLYDGGFGVIGPAPDAKLALALAAQTAPTVALVAQSPTGRRGACELARDLMRDWGVRSLVLEEAGEGDDQLYAEVDWRLPPGETLRLRRALAGDESGRPRA